MKELIALLTTIVLGTCTATRGSRFARIQKVLFVLNSLVNGRIWCATRTFASHKIESQGVGATDAGALLAASAANAATVLLGCQTAITIESVDVK